VGYDVAFLLDRLREAGADDQAAALASRAAAHAALDHPGAVARLLRSLREAGAREQAATLAGRLPAVGLFRLFLERNGLADQFRFGRETDGTPAAPWGWEDLDLWLVLGPRGTVRRLARLPTADPPNSQGKSGQFPVRTSGAALRSPAQRSGSSQSSRGQDSRALSCAREVEAFADAPEAFGGALPLSCGTDRSCLPGVTAVLSR
jgi:hypothetical protein